MESRRLRRRVIQIFAEWPARNGTVLKARSAAVLVGWGDGRLDWIKEADFGRLGISLIDDDGTMFDPKPGPLETLLARFMEGDKS
jgi:hypothetical protein